MLPCGTFDIGLREIVALEQKQDIPFPGKRVREDIAQIDSRGMMALAVAAVGFRRHGGLDRTDRLDVDEGLAQERHRGSEEILIATRDGYRHLAMIFPSRKRIGKQADQTGGASGGCRQGRPGRNPAPRT